MSARNRYLAAVSPRADDGVGGHGGLPSPANVRGRSRPTGSASGVAKVADKAKAPPPPPPGPPPPRRIRRGGGRVANGSDASSGSGTTPSASGGLTRSGLRAHAAASGGRDSSPSPDLDGGGEDASSTAGGAGASSAAVARSGTSWAPSDEIGSGGVARFQQLLWGGRKAGSPLNVGGDAAGGSSAGGPPGDGKATTPPRRPAYKAHAPQPLSSGPSAGASPRPAAPLSSGTPPRSSARAVSSPSRILGRSRGGGVGGGMTPPSTAAGPSPLQRRSRGLSLTPLDTSLDGSGGSQAGSAGGSAAGGGGGLVSSRLSQMEPPPSARKKVQSPFLAADRKTLPGGRPSPQMASPMSGGSPTAFRSPVLGSPFLRGDAPQAGTTTDPSRPPPSSSAVPSPGPGTVAARAARYGSPHAAGGHGVHVLTAFKRPGAKVGLVFTRLSQHHPEIATVSKVLPESIFARHGLGDEEPTPGQSHPLERAEVIAVNGVPVRDPRHAAEMVARAREEVRLSVKRGRPGAGEDQPSPRKDGAVGEDDGGRLRRVFELQRRVLELDARGGPSAASADESTIRTEEADGGADDDEEMSIETERVPRAGEKSRRELIEESLARKLSGPQGSPLTIRTVRAKGEEDEDDVSVRTEKNEDATIRTERNPRTNPRTPGREERSAAGVPSGDASASASASGAVSRASTSARSSAEVMSRRRAVAAAMLLSEELVEDPGGTFPDAPDADEPDDPIELDRSDDEAGNADPFDPSSPVPAGGGAPGPPSGSRRATSHVSSSASVVSSASAADRRRRAALAMYNSPAMVEDNVDDARLGTVGAATTLPPPPADAPPPRGWGGGSNVGTDVTTSSAATARMGGNGGGGPRRGGGFGSSSALARAAGDYTTKRLAASSGGVGGLGAPPPAPPPSALGSPSARRLERAALRGTSTSGPIEPPAPAEPRSLGTLRPPVVGRGASSQSAQSAKSEAPGTPGTAKVYPKSPGQASDVSSSSGAAMLSGVAGGRAASDAPPPPSPAGPEEAPSPTQLSASKSARRRFGRRGSRAPASPSPARSDDSPSSKKQGRKGIFGVAKLLRKASSKKKSRRGSRTSSGDDVSSAAAPSETASEAPSSAPPTPREEQPQMPGLMDQTPGAGGPSAVEQSPAEASDPFAPGGSEADWGEPDFFADPFKDAFGFPADGGRPEEGAASSSSFFGAGFSVPPSDDPPSPYVPMHSEDWGAGTGSSSGVLPVDFTPRSSGGGTAPSSSPPAHRSAGNLDALSSLDGPGGVPSGRSDDGGSLGSMSQLTNPTYAGGTGRDGGVDPDGEGAGAPGGADSSGSSARENRRDGGQQQHRNIAAKYKMRKMGKLPPSYGDPRRAAYAADRKAASQDDPPLALGSLDTHDTGSDDGDQVRDESEQGRDKSRSRSPAGGKFASSRILSRYGQRRPGAAPGGSVSGASAGSSSGQRSAGGGGGAATRRAAAATTAPSPSSAGKSAPPALRPPPSSYRYSRGGETSPVRRRRGGGATSPVKRSSPKASQSGTLGPYYSGGRRESPSVVDDPNYYNIESRLGQIKDPIQRAGVRLLWAAAIPIQTQARQFLARQAAIRRMCSVLTIQAFVRRWQAERDLEIAVWSAIQIQSAFRGWFARDSLEDNHYCATQIQRIVRGYLATMHVFEDLYSITIVQSVVRMHLAINVAVDKLSSIIAIQSWWRGVSVRRQQEVREYSAVALQSNWRRYIAQLTYQFDVIDIIIVQSVARRWMVRRELAAVRLQCMIRAGVAKNLAREKRALRDLLMRLASATRIQAAWRSHTASMRCKAMREDLLRCNSATMIQSRWRSYSAQVRMLVKIVNVIIVQSIWRRRTATKLYGPLLHRMKLAKQRKRNKAATAIQSAWRGYIDFSSYLIMRYEARASTVIQAYWRRYRQATTYSILIAQTITLQSLVRGYQERAWQSFRTDCAVAIQASARRFLTRKECHNECMVTILISAAAAALRARSAVRRLQSWWGGEMLKKRQKQAALVIERFFIFVKKEVEKEVKALKRKKKEKRRRRKLKQSDDYILEKAWMGLDGDTTALPTPEEQAVQHFHPPTVANLDSRKLYGKSDKFGSVDVDVQSDVSGLTDLSQQGGTYRTSKYSRRVPKKSQYDMDDDASLEQAYLDTEIQQSKNEKKYKSNKLPPSRRPNRSYARRY